MKLELKHIADAPYLKVSKCGKVYSNSKYGKKGGELAQFINKGYYKVSVYINGKLKPKGVRSSGISLCINNKLKTSGGFVWKS